MDANSPPVVFDDENPEWTDEDFARARPGAEVLPAEFVAALQRDRDNPPKVGRERVVITLDNAVLERLLAEGSDLSERINDTLRKAVGL